MLAAEYKTSSNFWFGFFSVILANLMIMYPLQIAFGNTENIIWFFTGFIQLLYVIPAAIFAFLKKDKGFLMGLLPLATFILIANALFLIVIEFFG